MTVHSKILMCRWKSWVVTGPLSLALHMAEGDCCNMDGAILVAKQLMPEVRVIQTYSGDQLDTAYHKEGPGEWAASIAPAAAK